MTGLVATLGSASLRDTSLIALLVIVGLLFLATLVFSATAVILRARNRAHEAENESLRERWREPVLSAVADPERVEAIQALVGEEDALHFVGFILEYVRRVRGEEGDTLRALARPFLPVVAAKARARTTEIRARAVQTLGTLGLPEQERVVLEALDDASPLVAMVAARSLSRVGTPEYARAVLARLERFAGWNRRFLASMLASMGTEVSEILRDRYAEDDEAPWTRAVLAEALRIQRDPRAADVAVRVLGRSADRELLAASFRLLDEVGRPEHAEAVRPHCSSQDAMLRALALRAMGTLGGPDDVAALLPSLSDPEPWPALYAARAVRDVGGRAVLEEVASSDAPTAPLARQVLGEELDPA